MYVGRTILRQVSTGTTVDSWPTFVRTRADVVALLPGNVRQRVNANPGDYEITYQLACYYRVRVIGRRRDAGHLVLDYDVWRTKAAADQGDPPDWTNTHTFAGRPKAWSSWTGAQKRSWLQSHIEGAILDAAHRDAIGDERDHRGATGPNDDTDLAVLDGTAVERT